MTNLSGRSRENLQLSAAQEERISLSSAVQSGSPYEAQGGLSQASPQAHDQQRELHRKPLRGLSQRIMLALTVLLTGLAALYSAAMVGVIGYTEEELISSFLEDDMDYVVSQIERGDTAIGLPHADVYGDAPGLKPVPAQFQDCPFGFTEITEAPAVFVWRRAWQGGSLMIVRDQEGFEEKEQELFILMLAVLLVVFLVGAAAGKRLAVQVMRPVEKLAAAVRAASSQNTWKPLPKELITRDEVGNLAAELSASMHRLFKALKREKAFTGDVSHELRTPLTVIETSVELLKLTELTAAQQRQVDKIERSSKMMHELVEGFLAFARLSENAGIARSERANNARREIAAAIPDLSGYDVVVIGSPYWWGGLSIPMRTFLMDHPLAGKRVLPFCVSASSSPSGAWADVRTFCPNAQIAEGFHTTESRAASSRDDLAAWLKRSGL